ncbi:MAG: FtsX-like permease family protein [Planctomycetia bacterium]|nr:FtsX-like permease family protein [Planctomycetia bacterium]
MKLVRQIAFRHLKAPQKGSFTTFAAILSILGLGLGIAALVLTFSILEGFESTISKKIAQFDGHIRVEHFMNRTLNEYDAVLDSVLQKSPVNYSITSYLQSPALLRKGSDADGVITIGLSKSGRDSILSSIVIEGTTELKSKSIIIGRRLAEDLGVEIGEKIVLFDLQSIGRISGNQRFRQFTVVGLFHSGLLEYDKTVVYIDIADAQYIFKSDSRVSGHMLFTNNLDDVKPLYRYLESKLGYPYFVLSWIDKHKILFDWINLQKWPILIIFGMISFVGIVNIVSSLSMIIFEKVREIGTLLSLGLSKKHIKRIFLLEGLIIGVLGSLLGLIIAIGLALLQIKFQIFTLPEDIYFMDHIPIKINWLNTILIISVGIVSAVIASLWPVYRASKINPAEALKYE